MSQRKLVPILIALILFVGMAVFIHFRAPNSASDTDYGVEPARGSSQQSLPSHAVEESRIEFDSEARALGGKLERDKAPANLLPSSVEANKDAVHEPEEEVVEPVVSRETWLDPVNRKVLGDKRWMAEPDHEELEHIESVLNSPMPKTRLGLEARSNSVSEMKLQIESCLAQYPTGGRVVVVWELEGNGTVTTSRDVRFGPIVDVVSQQFLDCVSSFTPPSSPTVDTFRMTVEYPAFLDDLQSE